jgi:hypothetical protein
MRKKSIFYMERRDQKNITTIGAISEKSTNYFKQKGEKPCSINAF